MKVGVPYGLKPGHTSTIRRIEGGMLSYHADLDSSNNPYEMGLGRLVDLNKDSDFIGKKALTEIYKAGVRKKQVGLVIDCDPFDSPNKEFWPIKKDARSIGKVTSAIYSPRLKLNIALALIDIGFCELGTTLHITIDNSDIRGTVVSLPFYDPKKRLAKR